MSSHDPVVAHRARLAVAVRIGKRIGYGALLVAIVAFAVGIATGFPRALVAVCIAGLVLSCIVLPVPIVMGYGIRAAERDERRQRAERDGPREQAERDGQQEQAERDAEQERAEKNRTR